MLLTLLATAAVAQEVGPLLQKPEPAPPAPAAAAPAAADGWTGRWAALSEDEMTRLFREGFLEHVGPAEPDRPIGRRWDYLSGAERLVLQDGGFRETCAPMNWWPEETELTAPNEHGARKAWRQFKPAHEHDPVSCSERFPLMVGYDNRYGRDDWSAYCPERTAQERAAIRAAGGDVMYDCYLNAVAVHEEAKAAWEVRCADTPPVMPPWPPAPVDCAAYDAKRREAQREAQIARQMVALVPTYLGGMGVTRCFVPLVRHGQSLPAQVVVEFTLRPTGKEFPNGAAIGRATDIVVAEPAPHANGSRLERCLTKTIGSIEIPTNSNGEESQITHVFTRERMRGACDLLSRFAAAPRGCGS
ncbi:MAG: hypothetical protein KTR31_31700 [Myxococcales bacterium]|nr:hypothetical protein [Myxococcales bacterium]